MIRVFATMLFTTAVVLSLIDLIPSGNWIQLVLLSGGMIGQTCIVILSNFGE